MVRKEKGYGISHFHEQVKKSARERIAEEPEPEPTPTVTEPEPSPQPSRTGPRGGREQTVSERQRQEGLKDIEQARQVGALSESQAQELKQRIQTGEFEHKEHLIEPEIESAIQRQTGVTSGTEKLEEQEEQFKKQIKKARAGGKIPVMASDKSIELKIDPETGEVLRVKHVEVSGPKQPLGGQKPILGKVREGARALREGARRAKSALGQTKLALGGAVLGEAEQPPSFRPVEYFEKVRKPEFPLKERFERAKKREQAMPLGGLPSEVKASILFGGESGFEKFVGKTKKEKELREIGKKKLGAVEELKKTKQYQWGAVSPETSEMGEVYLGATREAKLELAEQPPGALTPSPEIVATGVGAGFAMGKPTPSLAETGLRTEVAGIKREERKKQIKKELKLFDVYKPGEGKITELKPALVPVSRIGESPELFGETGLVLRKKVLVKKPKKRTTAEEIALEKEFRWLQVEGIEPMQVVTEAGIAAGVGGVTAGPPGAAIGFVAGGAASVTGQFTEDIVYTETGKPTAAFVAGLGARIGTGLGVGVGIGKGLQYVLPKRTGARLLSDVELLEVQGKQKVWRLTPRGAVSARVGLGKVTKSVVGDEFFYARTSPKWTALPDLKGVYYTGKALERTVMREYPGLFIFEPAGVPKAAFKPSYAISKGLFAGAKFKQFTAIKPLPTEYYKLTPPIEKGGRTFFSGAMAKKTVQRIGARKLGAKMTGESYVGKERFRFWSTELKDIAKGKVSSQFYKGMGKIQLSAKTTLKSKSKLGAKILIPKTRVKPFKAISKTGAKTLLKQFGVSEAEKLQLVGGMKAVETALKTKAVSEAGLKGLIGSVKTAEYAVAGGALVSMREKLKPTTKAKPREKLEVKTVVGAKPKLEVETKPKAVSIVVSREKVKPKAVVKTKVKSLEKVSVKTKVKPVEAVETRARVSFKLSEEMKTGEVTETVTGTAGGLEEVAGTAPRTKIVPKTKLKTVTVTEPVTVPPMVPPPKPAPFAPRLSPEESKLKVVPSKVRGYKVRVKKEGKKSRQLKELYGHEAAVSKGASVVDKGPATEFELQKTKRKTRKKVAAVSYPPAKLKEKFYRRGKAFVEKQKYRSDMLGELGKFSLSRDFKLKSKKSKKKKRKKSKSSSALSAFSPSKKASKSGLKEMGVL